MTVWLDEYVLGLQNEARMMRTSADQHHEAGREDDARICNRVADIVIRAMQDIQNLRMNEGHAAVPDGAADQVADDLAAERRRTFRGIIGGRS